MSLVFVIISLVALVVAYIFLGIAVFLSVRDARNTEDVCIQPYERHWWDFTEYVTDHILHCIVAIVGAVISVTALMISCI